MNNLEQILQTGVKFYASKSKAEAIALATQQENPEPGAICFVSDETGNYIILNGKIFGDGASGGGGSGGGSVYSVNGKTGAVVIGLGDLQVTANKTLADYFDDGGFLAESIVVQDGNGNDYITLNSDGITIGNSIVATNSYVNTAISNNNQLINQTINNAEQSAKAYADSLVVSLYKVKGSVANYTSLEQIANPSIGDVYNLTSTNMNYVYTEDGWDPLGGSIDLSTVYSKQEVNSLLSTNLQEAKNYTDAQNLVLTQTLESHTSSITTLSNSISDINSSLNNYNTRITNNTTNITNLATQLTWQ